MKRFKTVKPLICISLVLVVVVSIVLIVGRYIVLNSITETIIEMQLAENKKKAVEEHHRFEFSSKSQYNWKNDNNEHTTEMKLVLYRKSDSNEIEGTLFITKAEEKIGPLGSIDNGTISFSYIPSSYTIPNDSVLKSRINHIVIMGSGEYAFETTSSNGCNIDQEAFRDLPNLTSVCILSQKIVGLERAVFYNAPKLETVIICSSVDRIGIDSFGLDNSSGKAVDVYLGGINDTWDKDTMVDHYSGATCSPIHNGAFKNRSGVTLYCQHEALPSKGDKISGATIKRDGTAPTVVREYESGWTNSDVTLKYGITNASGTFLDEDINIGIYGTELANLTFYLEKYSPSGSEITIDKENQAITFSACYDKVKIFAYDIVGNGTREVMEVTQIDKEAPYISCELDRSYKGPGVKLLVEAGDDESGLSNAAYSFNGGDTWQSVNYKIYEEDTSNVHVMVKDQVGNRAMMTVDYINVSEGNTSEGDNESGGNEVGDNESGGNEVGSIPTDTTSPTVKVTGNPKSWTKNDVTLTVTATDESGIAGYKFNDEEWQTANSKTFSSNKDVTIKVKDNVGNISVKYVSITKIDKTAPTITSVAYSTLEPARGVSLIVNATDKNSGIAGYSFDDGDGEEWENVTSNTWAKHYDKNTSNIKIKVKDKAGNISAVKTASITNIDNTPPIIKNIDQDPKLPEYTNESVTLTVTATDTGCGLHDEPYSFDGGDWQKSNQTSISETKMVYIRVRDKLGNIRTSSGVLISNIDKKPPIVKVTGNPTEWTNKDVTLRIEAKDTECGLHDTPYSFDNGETWQKSTSKVYTKNTKNIVIQVRDKLGNTSTYDTINIDKIDKTVPTITNVLGNPTEWTKNDIKLTVSATGNGGSEVVDFSFDDGLTWQSSNQKTYGTSGLVKIKVRDEAGNISPVEVIDITKVDQNAPTISSVTGNPTAWTNQDVTLTITAKDNNDGCGLHDTPYSFDGGSTWQEANTKTYSSNANNIIIKVRDKLGNVATHDTINIDKIDKSNPTVNVTGNPTEWTNQDVTLTITATDTESGLHSTPYSFDNGETWIASNTKVFKENQDVIIKVKDVAGNITTYNKIVINKIDKNAPTIESVIKNPSTWTTGNVRLIITAKDNDDGCGLHDTPYSFDDGVTWQKSNEKTYTDNTKGIKVKVKDKLGNIATYQSIDITNIDRIKPTVKVTGNPTEWTNKDVTLTITAKDNDDGCGLHDKPYSFDGGSTWQKEASKVYTENTKNIVIKVRDKVGNTTTYDTIDILKIDKSVPTITNVEGNPTEWTNGPVTLTVSVTENCGSCIIAYSFDDGNTWQPSNQKTFAKNGEVIIKVKDEAGNISPSKTVNITKIKTAPDILIESDVYEVGELYASRVHQNTTVKTFTENIKHNANIKIYTKDNKEVKDTDIIGTGMVAKFTLNDQEKTLNIVVTGDLTGDGKASNSDLLRLARYMTGKEKNLAEIYLMASDVFEDNKYPNCIDLLKMARSLVGLDKI